MPTLAHATELRAALDDVAALTTRSITDLFDLTRGLTPMTATATLVEYTPEIIAANADIAATVTADWYDELRRSDNVDGRYMATLAPLPPTTQTEIMVRWAVSPLFDLFDWDAALANLLLGSNRLVRNTSSDTVIDNTRRDPQAAGWQRIARADGCAFCRMLAARGAVYRAEHTATFGAHDRCNCTAVPAWGGRPLAARPHERSVRDISDADRARVRDWMRANGFVD